MKIATLILLACLLFLAAGCASSQPQAAERLLFTLEDEADPASAPTPIDLASLRAIEAQNGVIFEAQFAGGVQREVAPRTSIYQQQQQQQPDMMSRNPRNPRMARGAVNEFRGLELDVYIDRREVEGGYAALLPGRSGTLAPGARWDKVVSLTPDPIEARASIRQRISQTATATGEEGKLREALRSGFDPIVYHADNVEVRGNSIRFFVPARALPGGTLSASDRFAVVAFLRSEGGQRMLSADATQTFEVADVIGSAPAGDIMFVAPVPAN
jgi:hypothetical protein